jgi:DNA-binding transcriptional LysR family regulator
MHIVDLVAEGLDRAVRMSAPADSSLVARKVAARRRIVCASPEYLSRRGTPARPEDLRKHNCLNINDMQWRFAFPDAIRSIRVRGSFNSDNGRTLVAAAVRGIGMVRITDYYVRNEISRGELRPVLEDFEVSDTATWIAYPDRHHLPTRVRLLIDFLADRLQEPQA